MPDKKVKPEELTWAQERAEDRCFEKVRTAIAIVIAIAGIGVLLILVWCRPDGASSQTVQVYDPALIAASVATAIVAGARALEGRDIGSTHRTRNALPPASQTARSWLSCFIAVAGVILLGQLINRIDLAPEEPSDAQSGMTVSGTLTVETSGRSENVEIAGRTED